MVCWLFFWWEFCLLIFLWINMGFEMLFWDWFYVVNICIVMFLVWRSYLDCCDKLSYFCCLKVLFVMRGGLIIEKLFFLCCLLVSCYLVYSGFFCWSLFGWCCFGIGWIWSVGCFVGNGWLFWFVVLFWGRLIGDLCVCFIIGFVFFYFLIVEMKIWWCWVVVWLVVYCVV